MACCGLKEPEYQALAFIFSIHHQSSFEKRPFIVENSVYGSSIYVREFPDNTLLFRMSTISLPDDKFLEYPLV